MQKRKRQKSAKYNRWYSLLKQHGRSADWHLISKNERNSKMLPFKLNSWEQKSTMSYTRARSLLSANQFQLFFGILSLSARLIRYHSIHSEINEIYASVAHKKLRTEIRRCRYRCRSHGWRFHIVYFFPVINIQLFYGFFLVIWCMACLLIDQVYARLASSVFGVRYSCDVGCGVTLKVESTSVKCALQRT